MAYQMPTDIDVRVKAQIASGNYPTAEDVLRDAMDGLERRQRSLANLQEMVRAAEEDVAADRVGPFDVDATMRGVERRLAAKASEK
jgi:Arc/MetJ-type ribon-helix-helix transcriptional regulator